MMGGSFVIYYLENIHKWLAVLVVAGRLLLGAATRKVVIQGG